MFKKQTSVSHSSTEAEVISLDACLRMEGIPALDLWDLVIEVLHTSPNQTNKTKDVSHISSTCCAKNSSLISCPETMAKRMQEQKEERSVAKSKSTATNLSSHVPTSSSSAKSLIASKSPGILIATVKPKSRMR